MFINLLVYITLVHLGFSHIEIEPSCFYYVFVSSEYVQLSPQDRTYCRLSCTSRVLLLSHTANPMPNTQHIKQQPGALVGSDEPSLVISRHVAKYRTTEHPLMAYINNTELSSFCARLCIKPFVELLSIPYFHRFRKDFFNL